MQGDGGITDSWTARLCQLLNMFSVLVCTFVCVDVHRLCAFKHTMFSCDRNSTRLIADQVH